MCSLEIVGGKARRDSNGIAIIIFRSIEKEVVPNYFANRPPVNTNPSKNWLIRDWNYSIFPDRIKI